MQVELNKAIHSRQRQWEAGINLKMHPESGRKVQALIEHEDSSAA